MLILIIASAAFCTTFAGGLFALWLKDRLHLVLGFSAGAVVGVAFFDLLPEAWALGSRYDIAATIPFWVGGGFLSYLVLDRVLWFHGHTPPHNAADHAPRGGLGAASLSVHSFFDGVAIGIAFQASASLGVVVTIAVLTHDFSDGINTMNIVLKNRGSRRRALTWLAIDAFAPVAGVTSTYFFTLPERIFGLVLAVFAGCFLYIGASDLIPESQHAHPKLLTTLMTLFGAGVMYWIVSFAAR